MILESTSRDNWEIEDDFRSLQRAAEIVKDEKRLKEVREFVKKQKESLDEILDDKYLKKIGLGE